MIGAFLAVVVATGTTMAIGAWLASWQRSTVAVSGDWSTTLPLLGGHQPEAHAWNRYHARYYPMALVLMAFEMEMMFMYPWAVVFVEVGGRALVEMGVFLALLSLGVLYLWREGGLSWQ